MRVLVVGGYGVFGARVAERLASVPGLEILIAGRNADRARAAQHRLEKTARAFIGYAVLDATRIESEQLARLKPDVIINASGPFQAQDYTLPRAAIEAGAHCIDLADARAYVTGITALDEAARIADVLVVSGASSVPGLSGAVVDAFAPEFACLRSVWHAISPGSSFDPGVATVASVLGAVGKPFTMRVAGREQTVFGWQGLHRRMLPGVGKRYFGDCNVPDLVLFPERWPTLETVCFAAGVEVASVHLGIWGLSWLARAGVLDPGRYAASLLALKRRLGFLGTDTGGMLVTLAGEGHDGSVKRIEWSMIARSGHGPYIPATAAVVLVKKLLAGRLGARGAMPCLGLFTLDEFMAELQGLDITCGAQ